MVGEKKDLSFLKKTNEQTNKKTSKQISNKNKKHFQKNHIFMIKKN